MRQTLERSLDLGRYGEGTTATPLLIQFGSRLAKNLTMESLYKKNLEPKFRNVKVVHIIKKEREECKRLVEEANNKTESEELGNGFFKSGALQEKW